MIGFAQPSNIYNTLSNITLLPNLSNQPQGQENNTNGTQTGGGGSNGNNTSASGQIGVSFSCKKKKVESKKLTSGEHKGMLALIFLLRIFWFFSCFYRPMRYSTQE